MTFRSAPLDQLPPAWIKTIDECLAGVAHAGHRVLLESEVYRILGRLGMAIPTHETVTAAEDVTPEVLAAFTSRKIVIKAASRELAHKQKHQGVDIVHRDLEFVRYRVGEMMTRMAAAGIDAEGVLLADCIDYEKELGNEILLGFRESDAFGPVISFSKGGSDAEHFAECFSPPNLILPPIDRHWAQALLDSTHIQKKYVSEGHADYTRKIVDAGMLFSLLATAFSNFFTGDTDYVFSEFEVNPFIFDPFGRFIALDGYARFEPRSPTAAEVTVAEPDSLSPFFSPDGVAVVGVSADQPDKPGNIIAANLLRMGRSDVYCINPKGGSAVVDGVQQAIHPSISALPRRVDLAVVAVPAAHALDVVRDCAVAGTRGVILISGGFSETDSGSDIERRIRDIARDHGMRIMGPNCLGILYPGHGTQPGINTFFIPEAKFHFNLDRQRNVAILSQSGALGITEIYNLRNAISPNVIVSYGNQLDIDAADLIEAIGKNPSVDVIGCYIEGFREAGGRKFFNTVSACHKPVVVYKAGRTESGRKATESHTASIAGEYEVAKAAMKQAGLIVADTMIDHGDFIKTFALLNDFPVRGNRVAIIANAGYEKTYAADNLNHLTLAAFDAGTQAELKTILPPYVSVDPMLDLTPMAGDAMFEQCIDVVLKCPDVDALFVSIVPHASLIHTTDEEIARNRENVAARIVNLVHRHRKPTVVSICVASGADAVYNRFGQILDAGGVPTFLTANRAMICLNAFVRYHLTRETRNFSEWLK
jgi:3-hydroxypropionyl-CoA synthetase (ADP-forming)